MWHFVEGLLKVHIYDFISSFCISPHITSSKTQSTCRLSVTGGVIGVFPGETLYKVFIHYCYYLIIFFYGSPAVSSLLPLLLFYCCGIEERLVWSLLQYYSSVCMSNIFFFLIFPYIDVKATFFPMAYLMHILNHCSNCSSYFLCT